MSASPGGGDPKLLSSRPSFTDYWKRSKDQQADKSLTFVSSNLEQRQANGQHGGQAGSSTQAKAQARRQQVRKAQMQHRQRKANYTQQLEMDIAKLRDEIAKVEQDNEILKGKNDAIRSQLARGGQTMPMTVGMPPASTADMAFSTCLAPDYTVSLDIPEYLGSPAFQVRRNSPSLADTSSRVTSSHATDAFTGTTPTSTVGTSLDDFTTTEMTMSEEQTDRAVNFILALEHCCWDHVDQSSFEYQDHHYNHAHAHDSVNDEIDDDAENGHALTATALALQSAPLDVFTRLDDLQQQLQQIPSPAFFSLGSSSSPYPSSYAAAAPISWPSKGLTLSNLRHLARTLNPSDSELAPVQGWFEFLRLYGVEVATNHSVLDELKRELVKEVKCVKFGAAVQRGVFEDVLGRVMGYLPPSPQLSREAREDPLDSGGMVGFDEGAVSRGEGRDYEENTKTGKHTFFRRLMHTTKGSGGGGGHH
ncbi:hypothetical protein F5Y19DRAFT_8902 [Xylariaceae sp. FL1651]|nr:hypothetical protein F5Y19DRAFT_8902 [Xylariaceae sp. FL1651]